MDSILDIARWQFGIITVYHFLFVPLTIGLTALVAGHGDRLAAHRSSPEWLRLTKFFGEADADQLRDRRRHRHRAGVPVRHELVGLLAVRRRRLRRPARDRGAARVLPRVDVPRASGSSAGTSCRAACTARCMWIVHLGTLASAYFILAANSWMQHPVGYSYNPDTGRAELTDFWAVMTNKVQLVTFPHVIAGGVHDRAARSCSASPPGSTSRKRHEARPRDVPQGRSGSAPAVALVAGLGVAVTGDVQGKIMTEVQPMKMAAAEALYDTEESCAPFSIFTIGTPGRHQREVRDHGPVPAVLPRHRAASTARSRASTTCARSTRRSTARTRARRTTRPTATCRSSRSPTGRSAS